MSNNKDICCICKKAIESDGNGVGTTGLFEGKLRSRSYHGNCYNLERMRDVKKGQREKQRRAQADN